MYEYMEIDSVNGVEVTSKPPELHSEDSYIWYFDLNNLTWNKSYNIIQNNNIKRIKVV